MLQIVPGNQPADYFCANVGLSTTYDISIFVWFLALCRVVVEKASDCRYFGAEPMSLRRIEPES